MNIFLSYLKDESGIALVNALVIMVLLTALGTYAINMTEIDQTLAGNLKASKQAFYIAEAGLEWGRQQVRTSTAIPPRPADATQSLDSGSYAVTFLQPTPSVQGAWEYTVPVQVTGNLSTASKTLQALVTKTFDLSDAAIAMRGNEADSYFNGNAFLVDGRDYDHLTDTLTSAPEQLGISVPTTTLKSAVEGALGPHMLDNIKGTGGTSSNPSIDVSSSLSSATIADLASALCPSTLPTRYTLSTGESRTYSGSTTFGTRVSPIVYCFDGLGTPGTMDVELNGNFSGVGILIVRHADLIARGNFKYEGLIIVTGNKVGFGMMGGGQQDVYGSVLINETDHDGTAMKELYLTGNAAVKRSRSALAMAKLLLSNSTSTSTMSTIVGGLPSSVMQVSWSEVSD